MEGEYWKESNGRRILYLLRGDSDVRRTPVTAENTADPSAPDTIVLIHGLWVTPRSWEYWIEHYEGIVGELDKPPILMGHSMGGLVVQIMLDHGYGAAGVAIDSVPPEGV